MWLNSATVLHKEYRIAREGQPLVDDIINGNKSGRLIDALLGGPEQYRARFHNGDIQSAVLRDVYATLDALSF